MSFFKSDTSQVKQGFVMIKEGRYEAVICNVTVGKVMSNQQPKLQVDYEIRSDVEQEFKGSKVLYNDYRFDTEINVNITNSLISAVGFPHGTDFESPEHMAQMLHGKAVQITVKHEASYNDATKIYPKAKFTNPSNRPLTQQTQQTQQYNPTGQQVGQLIEVSPDDLPF